MVHAEAIYIRAMREKAGLSQLILAKKLGWTSPQFVSNIERGLCYLPMNKLKKFIQVTGASKEVMADLKRKAFEDHLQIVLKKIRQ